MCQNCAKFFQSKFREFFGKRRFNITQNFAKCNKIWAKVLHFAKSDTFCGRPNSHTLQKMRSRHNTTNNRVVVIPPHITEVFLHSHTLQGNCQTATHHRSTPHSLTTGVIITPHTREESSYHQTPQRCHYTESHHNRIARRPHTTEMSPHSHKQQIARVLSPRSLTQQKSGELLSSYS
jgi:hypothetical protein